MNKALLLSIQSSHLANVLNRFKKLELRLTIPKDLEKIIKEQGGIWVNLYCTKNYYRLRKNNDKYEIELYGGTGNPIGYEWLNGKVVARFWLDEWFHIFDLNKGHGKFTYGYSQNNYLFNVDFLLDNLRLTEKEIYAYGKGKTLYAWEIDNLEIFDKPKELSEFYVFDKEKVKTPLTKAPQSWQYVWVEK